jgi:hypothetical protein
MYVPEVWKLQHPSAGFPVVKSHYSLSPAWRSTASKNNPAKKALAFSHHALYHHSASQGRQCGCGFIFCLLTQQDGIAQKECAHNTTQQGWRRRSLLPMD